MLAQNRVRVDRLRHLGVFAVADRAEDEAVEPGQRLQRALRHGMAVGIERAPADRQRRPRDGEAAFSRRGLRDAHRRRHDLVADVVAREHAETQASGCHGMSFYECYIIDAARPSVGRGQPAALRSLASGTEASATAAARSIPSMVQARSSRARDCGSPITSLAWFMNLVSSCSLLSGFSRLPMARSMCLVSVEPSLNATSTVTEASWQAGSAVAVTLSRSATISGRFTTSSVKAVGAPSPRSRAQAAE